MAKVAQHPKLADIPNEAGLKPIHRYACKMATGSGKTVVMAMLIAWAFCNRGTNAATSVSSTSCAGAVPESDDQRAAEDVLRFPGDTNNYYEMFEIVPSTLRSELAKGKVLVTNWHWLAPEAEVQNVGGAPIVKLGRGKRKEAFARNRLGDLWDDEPLMVLNDERGTMPTGPHRFPKK